MQRGVPSRTWAPLPIARATRVQEQKPPGSRRRRRPRNNGERRLTLNSNKSRHEQNRTPMNTIISLKEHPSREAKLGFESGCNKPKFQCTSPRTSSVKPRIHHVLSSRGEARCWGVACRFGRPRAFKLVHGEVLHRWLPNGAISRARPRSGLASETPKHNFSVNLVNLPAKRFYLGHGWGRLRNTEEP